MQKVCFETGSQRTLAPERWSQKLKKCLANNSESESDLTNCNMEYLDGSFYFFCEINEQSTIFHDDERSNEDEHYSDNEIQFGVFNVKESTVRCLRNEMKVSRHSYSTETISDEDYEYKAPREKLIVHECFSHHGLVWSQIQQSCHIFSCFFLLL